MATFQAARRIVSTSLDDDRVMIMRLEDGALFEFNSTASLIWTLVTEGQSNAETAAQVAQVYDISESEARQHVDQFVDDLHARGMLRTDGRA